VSSPPYVVYGAGSVHGRLLVRIAAVATLGVAVLAVLAFVLLSGGSGAGHPTATHHHAATAPKRLVTQPVKQTAGATPPPATVKHVTHVTVIPPPSATPVVVLNSNGVHGAASTAASQLAHFGYATPVVTNASTQGLPTTVMYRHGYGPAARALSRRLGNVKVVEPLDGVSPGSLGSADLVLIVGT
jgi:hypothetical protein